MHISHSFSTSEGYYDYRKKQYIYQYKDHLGNVRMSYVRNNSNEAKITDHNDYYAFGMNHLSPSGGESMYDPLAGTYKYKYNGKELQETGMYDYGWRMYMPDIARWNGIDQLAEKYGSFSPYAYVMNNPISFFDPDGRDMEMPDWLKNLWNASINENQIYTFGGFDSSGSPSWMTSSNFSQEQYTGFYNFISSGQPGTYQYWTGGAETSYRMGNEIYASSDIVMRSLTITGNQADSSWEGTKNLADWSATAMGGMFKYTAESRSNFYNGGNWIDNLGNIRSTKYAGRAKGSLIGLRSDYVKATAMYSKYAKGAGMVGYAISAGEIGYGVYEDGGKFGHNAQVKTVGVAGGMAGAASGAWALGKVFGAAGLLVGPEGAVVAGAVGAIMGGIAGGYYGGEYMEEWAESILK